MSITIEQAKTLLALHQYGSYEKAAEILEKGHSALIYTLKAMETAAGVKLLDRSGYRTKLTPIGYKVLEQCKLMIAAEETLENLCLQAKHGWEPFLTVVFDGFLPLHPIIMAVNEVGQLSPYTKISLFSEYLSSVEERFVDENAHIMVSVLPISSPDDYISLDMPSIKSFLVCHHQHPLANNDKKNAEILKSYALIKVRGPDQKLNLSTSHLSNASTYNLSDFYAKKMAILQGIGYGWMPEHYIKEELAKQTLKIIHWEGDNVHNFTPKMYFSRYIESGKAQQAFVESLRGHLEKAV